MDNRQKQRLQRKISTQEAIIGQNKDRMEECEIQIAKAEALIKHYEKRLNKLEEADNE